jgi:hypothetical protein
MNRCSFLLAVIVISSHAHAQTDSLYDVSPEAYFDRFHVSVTGVVGFPSSELKEAVTNNFGDLGIGFAVSLLVNPLGSKKPSPIFMGIDFSYLTYGVDKIDASASYPQLKTTFNVYNISGAFRFVPKHSPGFSPFIDGMIGSRIFNTRTKVDKNALQTLLNEDQPEVVNTTNDAGICYTLGTGFFVRKIKNSNDEGKGAFTLRVLYSWGDDVEYIKRDSIQLDQDGFLTYEKGRTRTDMLVVQVGFLLY